MRAKEAPWNPQQVGSWRGGRGKLREVCRSSQMRWDKHMSESWCCHPGFSQGAAPGRWQPAGPTSFFSTSLNSEISRADRHPARLAQARSCIEAPSEPHIVPSCNPALCWCSIDLLTAACGVCPTYALLSLRVAQLWAQNSAEVLRRNNMTTAHPHCSWYWCPIQHRAPLYPIQAF